MSRTLIILLIVGIISGIGINTARAQSRGDPLTWFETTNFSGSGRCATCHSNLIDSGGNDVSIETHWRATTMANSAKDPLWQAKVESEITRNPALQATIEQKCSTCHMPMAHTQASANGTTIAIFGDGFLNPANPLHQAGMDGTSCTLCHQISDENLEDPSTFSGHYPIDTSTTPPNRPIYGQYAGVFQNPMRHMVGYTPVQGSQMEASELCATCHTLYTTAVDGDGNPLPGEFPEQTPYLEWEHSDYGDGEGVDTSCQDCHIPLADGSVEISNMPPWLTARPDFGLHYFVGGNSFIVSILRDHGTDLGVTASTAQFDDTISRTRTMLQKETATLAIESAQVAGSRLNVEVRINSHTGHKFPSGIPIRRAWIHLTVADETGKTVFESGAPLANGSIRGNDADTDQTTYEPHYDLITDSSQVQIYEPIMLNSDGEVTYTLLRATAYAKDNRLLPTGFDKNTGPADVAVYGNARSDDDFVGGADNTRYDISVPTDAKTFTVSAELLYQPVTYAFVQDLRQDSGAYIDRFVGYFDTADHMPEIVASHSISVGVSSPSKQHLVFLPVVTSSRKESLADPGFSP